MILFLKPITDCEGEEIIILGTKYNENEATDLKVLYMLYFSKPLAIYARMKLVLKINANIPKILPHNSRKVK